MSVIVWVIAAIVVSAVLACIVLMFTALAAEGGKPYQDSIRRWISELTGMWRTILSGS